MALLNGDVNGGGNPLLPPGIVPPTFGPLLPGVKHNERLPNQEDHVEVARTLGVPFNTIAGLQFIQGDDKGGDCVRLVIDLFWNGHLHLIPKRFDLGNILATQVRNYELYNAKFVDATVQTIDTVGFDGITITSGPDTPPFLVGRRSGITFEVTVGTVGPPQVNATKTYNFLTGEGLTLTITGTRIVVFPLVPFTPINEIYSWKTDIQKGLSGFEQRTQLRDLPRLSYSFPYRRNEEEMAFSENQFYEWMGRLWAMPQWVDFTELTSDVSAGATNIPVVSTADRDFRAGAGELGVIYDEFDNFEAFEISAINPTSIDTLVPLNSGFSAGAKVLPVRFAWLKSPVETAPWVIKVRDMQLQFDVTEGIDYGDDFAGLATTYKSLPVFDLDLLITGLQYQRNFEKRLDRIDNEIGLIDQNTVQDYPEAFDNFSLYEEGRAQIAALKRLLFSFKGRQKTVWVPTHRDDFQIESDLAAPTQIMRVKRANYEVFLLSNQRTRQDIRVTYVDGSVDLREITNAVDNPGFEEISVDSLFSQDMTQANVARIEYIVRRRLTTDDLKFTWELNEKVLVNLGFKDVLS